jgi:glutaredoxin 3
VGRCGTGRDFRVSGIENFLQKRECKNVLFLGYYRQQLYLFAMKTVTIYTKDHCPYCTAAKDFFNTKEVPYKEIDVQDEANEKGFFELVEKHNHRTVPMILIGDEFVGGYDNLMELQKEGSLDQMLGE